MDWLHFVSWHSFILDKKLVKMKFLILLILVATLADFGRSDEPPDSTEYVNEKDECIKVGNFIEDCNKCDCTKIGEPKSCSKMICSRNPYPGPAPPSKPKPTTKRTTKKPTTTKKLKPTTTKKQTPTTTKKQNHTTTKKQKPNTTRKENNHDTTTKKNKSLSKFLEKWTLEALNFILGEQKKT